MQGRHSTVRMDILFLARAVNGGGNFGDSVHVRELVSAWVRLGHSVDLVCLSENTLVARSESEESGTSVRIVPIPVAGILRFYSPRQLLAAFRILREIKSREFDVIYARPSVGLAGTFDVLIEVLASRLAGIPLVLEINGWAEDDASILRVSRFFHFRRMVNALVRMLFSRVSGFVAVTTSLANRLHQDMRVNADKITVIPNGADPNMFRPSDRTTARLIIGIPPNSPVLAFVGHVGLEADLSPVVQALPTVAQRYPDIVLLVVGDGPDRSAYLSAAKEIDVDSRIILTGTVPHERVPLYIEACDVGLVAIKERLSSMPMKLFEYWSCGRPVVATNLPDHRLVEEVGGGLLAANQLPAAWAASICRLLDSPRTCEEMGAKGREYVLRERTWARTADSVTRYLQAILEGNA